MDSFEGLRAAVHAAHIEHSRQTLIECAGLFWIFAELVILLGVIAGRGHLESAPRAERFHWTPALTRKAVFYAVGFGLLVCCTLGRHVFLEPVYHYLEGQARAGQLPDAAFMKALWLRRTHQHLVLWAAFVTGWVALETLILYHGWRGYCQLKTLLVGNGGER